MWQLETPIDYAGIRIKWFVYMSLATRFLMPAVRCGFATGTKMNDCVSPQKLCSQPPLESLDYLVELSIDNRNAQRSQA